MNEEKGKVMKAAYPKPGSTDENGLVPSFPKVGQHVPSHRTFRSSVKLTIRCVLTCVSAGHLKRSSFTTASYFGRE